MAEFRAPPLPFRNWTIRELHQALALRSDGATYRAIGKALNRTPLGVRKCLKKRG